MEYYKNVRHDIVGKMLFLWHLFLFKRLSWKLKCVIFPNTVGPGLHFYHIGSFIHIGKNCQIYLWWRVISRRALAFFYCKGKTSTKY